MPTIISSPAAQATYDRVARAIDTMINPWAWNREAQPWATEWSATNRQGTWIISLDDTQVTIQPPADGLPSILPLSEVTSQDSHLRAHLTYMLAESNAPEVAS